MNINSSPWYQQYTQNALQGMVHYLEAYPLPTSMILMGVHLMSLVGCAWLLQRFFSFLSGEKAGDLTNDKGVRDTKHVR